MKFFAALIAKLTGGAEAPKTLDQARSTFTEAKAALDKIGSLFVSAALDLDGLLAKGDNALKEMIAEFSGKITTAEAKVTDVAGKLAAAELIAATANDRALAIEGLLSSIGFKPSEVKGKDGGVATAGDISTALQTQFKTHVSGAVTQQLQEIGQPGKTLPAATTDIKPGAGALLAEFNAMTDPVAAGKFYAEKIDPLFKAAAARN